jgi:hypothetical protein
MYSATFYTKKRPFKFNYLKTLGFHKLIALNIKKVDFLLLLILLNLID